MSFAACESLRFLRRAEWRRSSPKAISSLEDTSLIDDVWYMTHPTTENHEKSRDSDKQGWNSSLLLDGFSTERYAQFSHLGPQSSGVYSEQFGYTSGTVDFSSDPVKGPPYVSRL
jgi:hypothetical protein